MALENSQERETPVTAGDNQPSTSVPTRRDNITHPDHKTSQPAAIRSSIPRPEPVQQKTRAPPFEPAPPGRSKKRKVGRQPEPPLKMIRLGEPIERSSERLSRTPKPVKLSTEDKAQQIVLDDSNLVASSCKGYRTVRSTHGAHSGTWYYEATIQHLGETGAVRLGWSTRRAELNAPVGSDEWGYAYRSIQGSRVHQGLRESYGREFGENDVIGCLIHLPPGGRPLEKTADDVVKYKGHLYYVLEDDDMPSQGNPMPDSYVEFYVNGESQGKTYVDSVREGTYYPSISMYTHPRQVEVAQVKTNFGATPFAFPVQEVALSKGDGSKIPVLPACQLPHAAPPADDDN